MITLTFVFDREKVAAAGKTEDELLAPMREHAKKYDIEEIEYGVFSRDDEHGMCVLCMFVVEHTETHLDYISYLDKWILNIDGEEEDCIDSVLRWYQKEGIQPIGIGEINYAKPKSEEKFPMITLTFIFDKEKVAAAGKTEDELLAPMREHAKKYDIEEIEYGVFSRNDEHGMCVLCMFVVEHTETHLDYISYLDKWILNIDGEEEDCIDSVLRWYQKEGIQPIGIGAYGTEKKANLF